MLAKRLLMALLVAASTIISVKAQAFLEGMNTGEPESINDAPRACAINIHEDLMNQALSVKKTEILLKGNEAVVRFYGVNATDEKLDSLRFVMIVLDEKKQIVMTKAGTFLGDIEPNSASRFGITISNAKEYLTISDVKNGKYTIIIAPVSFSIGRDSIPSITKLKNQITDNGGKCTYNNKTYETTIDEILFEKYKYEYDFRSRDFYSETEKEKRESELKSLRSEAKEKAKADLQKIKTSYSLRIDNDRYSSGYLIDVIFENQTEKRIKEMKFNMLFVDDGIPVKTLNVRSDIDVPAKGKNKISVSTKEAMRPLIEDVKAGKMKLEIRVRSVDFDGQKVDDQGAGYVPEIISN